MPPVGDSVRGCFIASAGMSDATRRFRAETIFPQARRGSKIAPKAGRRMPDDPISAKEALLAAMRSGRKVTGLWRNPQRALEIIRPYADCEKYEAGERVKPEDRDKLVRVVRSIVCSVTADCYREMGDVRTAAEWYRRAGWSWKVGGFPPIYADMVLQHQLADHYETALDFLQSNLADWEAKPFLVRIYWHVASGWWLKPWHYRLIWRTFLRQSALVDELQAALASARSTRAMPPDSQ